MTKTEVSRAEKCRVIAEKVMGWHSIDGGWGRWYNDKGEHVQLEHEFDPFSDPAAMVEILNRMSAVFVNKLGGRESWSCIFGGMNGVPSEGDGLEGLGPTPMHAVADAAYQHAISKAEDGPTQDPMHA